jgi:hypothetical protein
MEVAHAQRTSFSVANQQISRELVTSLLVQAKAENKRFIRTSRKTTEISEPVLTT